MLGFKSMKTAYATIKAIEVMRALRKGQAEPWYYGHPQGWLYLAIVMDLCSRKIVSWAFSDKPDSALTIRALRLAVNKRRPTGPVVFHSDQGA